MPRYRSGGIKVLSQPAPHPNPPCVHNRQARQHRSRSLSFPHTATAPQGLDTRQSTFQRSSSTPPGRLRLLLLQVQPSDTLHRGEPPPHV